MKVLVLGATGLLGREIYRELRLRDAAKRVVAGAGGARARGDVLRVDALDPDDVRRLLRTATPDVVVNAVGERRADHWSAARLDGLNVQLPELVAAWCHAVGAWLLHVSSDYVFDGRCPPYRPQDRRRPLNPYGQSKVDGEDAVLRACESATVLRVPVLHGPVEHATECTLASLISTVASGKPVAVDDWAVRYPTDTRAVAAVVADMLDHADAVAGLTCHWSGDEAFTKYAMARAVGRHLGLATDQLRPERCPDPARPHDPRLDCQLLADLGLGTRTTFAQSLPGVVASVLEPGGVL